MQQLYGNLADEVTEHALLDRGSWQRFIGMANTRDLPDARTIWHFKNQLACTSSTSELFADVQRQLNAAGLVAKGGQMMDATVVPSPKMHFTKDEKETIAKGKTPAHWRDKQAAHKGYDAHWSAKRGYDSATNRQTLKANKLRDGVARNDDRKRYDQTDIHARNHKLSRIRARVEHVFGAWEKVIAKSIRCVGPARAKAQITMQTIVVNLRRWVTLDGEGASAA